MARINTNRTIDFNQQPDEIEIGNIPTDGHAGVKIVGRENEIRSAILNEEANLIVLPRFFGLTGAFNSLAEKLDHSIRSNQKWYQWPSPIDGFLSANKKTVLKALDRLDNVLTNDEQVAAQIIMNDFDTFSHVCHDPRLAIEAPTQNENNKYQPRHDISYTPKTKFGCAYNVAGNEFFKNEDVKLVGQNNYELMDGAEIYQFGCSTITKSAWVHDENQEGCHVYRKPNIAESQHLRMSLSTN